MSFLDKKNPLDSRGNHFLGVEQNYNATEFLTLPIDLDTTTTKFNSKPGISYPSCIKKLNHSIPQDYVVVPSTTSRIVINIPYTLGLKTYRPQVCGKFCNICFLKPFPCSQNCGQKGSISHPNLKNKNKEGKKIGPHSFSTDDQLDL